MGRPSRTIEEVAQSLLQKSIINGECHEYHLSTDSGGYGQTYYGSAHRVVWKGVFGETDLCVLHTCDNRCCINPEHLFIGTIQDNVDDMIRKDRKKIGFSNVLTIQQQERVRELYKTGRYTHNELATTFYCSKNTIWRTLSAQHT